MAYHLYAFGIILDTFSTQSDCINALVRLARLASEAGLQGRLECVAAVAALV